MQITRILRNAFKSPRLLTSKLMDMLKHDCSQEIRKADLKSTPARVAVLKYLESIESPVDVLNILDYLEKNNLKFDQATVYRILDLFYKKGFVQKIEFGEGKYRYEKNQNHHHHLICTNCGSIEDVAGDFVSDIEENIKKDKGFKVKSHTLEFFGLCKNCQS